MAWLTANWKDVVLVLVAIDAALIPIFPSVGFLAAIKNFLSNLAGPSAS